MVYWIKGFSTANAHDINKSKQGYMQNSLAEICQFVLAFLIQHTTFAIVKWFIFFLSRISLVNIYTLAKQRKRNFQPLRDNDKSSEQRWRIAKTSHFIKIHAKIHKYYLILTVCDDDHEQSSRSIRECTQLWLCEETRIVVYVLRFRRNKDHWQHPNERHQEMNCVLWLSQIATTIRNTAENHATLTIVRSERMNQNECKRKYTQFDIESIV